MRLPTLGAPKTTRSKTSRIPSAAAMPLPFSLWWLWFWGSCGRRRPGEEGKKVRVRFEGRAAGLFVPPDLPAQPSDRAERLRSRRAEGAAASWADSAAQPSVFGLKAQAEPSAGAKRAESRPRAEAKVGRAEASRPWAVSILTVKVVNKVCSFQKHFDEFCIVLSLSNFEPTG